MRHVPIRDAAGTIKEMVPESDVQLLALLDIEEEEEIPAQPIEPPRPQTRSHSLADMLPPEPGQTTQVSTTSPSPQAKVQAAFAAVFLIIAAVVVTQFLQPRTGTPVAVQATPPPTVIHDAVQPTIAPAPTALAYAAPDGIQLGPVSLDSLPTPLGRYGATDWLYFEFAPPTGAVWLRAGDVGMEVSPALKDMKPAPITVPYNPPAAPVWTEPVAESAPVEQTDPNQQLQSAPVMTPVPPRHFQDEVAGAVLDPAGAAENGIKKLIDADNGSCAKNKQTGETSCE